MKIRKVKKYIKGRWVWVLVISSFVLVFLSHFTVVKNSIQAIINNQSWTTK